MVEREMEFFFWGGFVMIAQLELKPALWALAYMTIAGVIAGIKTCQVTWLQSSSSWCSLAAVRLTDKLKSSLPFFRNG